MLQGAAGLIVAFQGGGWGMGALSVLGILFGLFLVINPLIGVAALIHAIAVGVRSRRHDLGILRALGFTEMSIREHALLGLPGVGISLWEKPVG